eukprot:Em0016g749a
MLEAGMYQGVSAKSAEHRKHTENDPKCVELGWRYIPLAVESYGAWGPEASKAFSQVATRLAIWGNTPKAKIVAELYGRLSLLLLFMAVLFLFQTCLFGPSGVTVLNLFCGIHSNFCAAGASNLDILGVLIGDYLFCASKCHEAQKLVAKLEEIAGHHATTCKRGVMLYFAIGGILPQCIFVGLGGGTQHSLSQSRPADFLVQDWDRGKSAAFDICVVSPRKSNVLFAAGATAGAASKAAELRKHTANDAKWTE